jgi:hypothetical protein
MSDNVLEIGISVDLADLQRGLQSAVAATSAAAKNMGTAFAGQNRAWDQGTREWHEYIAARVAEEEGAVEQGKAAAQERAEQDQWLVSIGMMSERQKLADLKQALNERYEAEVAAYARELSLAQTEYGAESQEYYKAYEKVYQKLIVAQQQYELQSAKLAQQGITQQVKHFDEFFQHINSGFRTAMNGVIQGTQSLNKAFDKMGLTMVAEFAAALEKMMMQWIAGELKMLLFHQATEAAKTTTTAAATAERNSISATSSLREIMHAAATAAAHAYSAVAAIPVVGPVLAPAAAAAAFAGVMAFDTLASAAGGWERVPDDQMALVHKNEMVLPANLAGGFRTMLSRPNYAFAGEGGGAGGLGAPNLTTHVHVNATDLEGANRYANHIGDRVSAQAMQRMKRFLRTKGVMG